MSFLAPDRLWLLLLVPLLLGVYVFLQRRRSIYAIRFTNIALIDRIAPRRPSWGRHLAVGLALLTMAMVVVAFAKPVGPTQEGRNSSAGNEGPRSEGQQPKGNGNP